MVASGRMKYSELVDIPKLQALMESFSQVIGIANAVIDVDGVVIVHAGWQDACTGYHRVNPESCRRCIESDTSLVASMTQGVPFAIYRCHNGLVDTAARITVEGEHVANVFTGQFLTEPPDLEFFRRQARQFGFDEAGYLDAISRVPVLPKERVESVTRLYAQLAGVLADNGLDRLRQLEAAARLASLNSELEAKVAARTQALARVNEDLAAREAQLKQILDTSSVAIFLVDKEGRITQANQRMAEMFGWPPDQLVGSEYVALVHPAEREIGRQKMLALLNSAIPAVDLDRLYWRADHTEFWGHLTGKRFHDASGEEIGLVGVIADITERRKAEEAVRESERKYRLLFEQANDGIFLLDETGFVDCNQHGARMYGLTMDQVIGRSPAHLSPERQPDGRLATQVAAEKIDAAMRGEIPRFEWMSMRADGTPFDVEVTLSRVEIGGRTYVQSIERDISERKRAEIDLRIAATAFESHEGMFITDTAGVILRVNRSFSEITGYSAEEAVGQTPRLLNSGRHDAAFFAAMTQCVERSGTWQGEIWNRRKSGEVYPEWLMVTAVKDDVGRATHYVGTFTDITSRKTAEDEIRNLAFYDPLTRLPNRRLLLDRLQQALAASTRSARYGALLFIDLDNFKTLNDTLGHDIGDLLLQQVAQRLSGCVREGDTVARLGGDEFVVMLEDLSNDPEEAATQVETVGEKILLTLNQTYHLARYEYHNTPSIGVTLFADHEGTMDELLKRADLAMYQAKAAGRNTLRFFDPEMQAVVNTRAALEAGLREAVRQDQFILYYQAQVTGEGRLTGAEALLRWRHPERGLVSPLEFIPLAEDTGLILPLGHWVLQTACAQLSAWAGRPEMAHLTIAVNVSVRQFRHRDFVDQVLAILDHTGANPQRLKLELTESLLVDDVEDVIAKMAALKARGVGFSLDDFGTGYSSLSYLKRLPLDQLKIDQGFVRDILIDPNDAAIAEMVVALAASLGLAVLAEGVETEAQREFLSRQGCHAYQGYLFGRPLPLEQFEASVGPG